MPFKKDLNTQLTPVVAGVRERTALAFPTFHTLRRLAPDQQLNQVCERYKFWLLTVAHELAQKPDTGYAVVALLNSYFEMIAQLHGVPRPGSRRVNAGIVMVFPELANKDALVKLIAKHLRNPLANLSGTSDLIICLDFYDEALVWGTYRGDKALVINPRLWVQAISAHFDRFVEQLRDPDPKYNLLRQKFFARINERL